LEGILDGMLEGMLEGRRVDVIGYIAYGKKECVEYRKDVFEQHRISRK
jgi:hypothetical protein